VRTPARCEVAIVQEGSWATYKRCWEGIYQGGYTRYIPWWVGRMDHGRLDSLPTVKRVEGREAGFSANSEAGERQEAGLSANSETG